MNNLLGRFGKYKILVIAMMTLTTVFSCTTNIVAQQVNQPDLDLFSDLIPKVEETSVIPVLAPDVVVPRTENQLYPEIFDARQQAYELAYGNVPNCSNAGFCREGWIQGYQVGIDGYKTETIAALIEERENHLETATRKSDDSIEALTLIDGTEAVVLPWIGYTHPGPTEVIFEKDGYRYVFAVVMADNDYVIALTNSALD